MEILVRNFYFEEMTKAIRENLSEKRDPVLTELNDCFKVVSATLLPSERGVYITDNKVQCRLVVGSYLPKPVKCTRAAISSEVYKDKTTEKRTPAKGYKTDLSVNGSVGTQASSPKKATGDQLDESDTSNLITR